MNAPTSPASVLCAGRVYCDLVFTGLASLPAMGEETFSDAVSLHAGGGAFITAATFQALGWQAALMSTLPAAPFDAIVRRDIARAGVNDAMCRQAADESGPQITVAMATGGDRAFLSHKAGHAVPPVEKFRRGWRHLHIGELRSLVEHPELIRLARDAGMTVSLDCGYDEELLKDGSGMASLIAGVDVFLPNAVEFERLCASGLPDGAAPLTVVKCGERGARLLGDDGWIAGPTEPVDVLDATGAGDAFNGGFLASWLSDMALEACLAEGNRCGAAAVQQPGGTCGLRNLSREEKAVSARVVP